MNIVDLDKLSELFWDGNFMEIHKDDISSIPSAFEGKTNGEVIKALFPHYDHEDKTEYFGRIRNMDNHFIKADIDFWNAPYKAESEG